MAPTHILIKAHLSIFNQSKKPKKIKVCQSACKLDPISVFKIDLFASPKLEAELREPITECRRAWHDTSQSRPELKRLVLLEAGPRQGLELLVGPGEC